MQSSIAYTAIARGNVAAAVVSASFSNLLGIFLTPLLVALLMQQGGAGGAVSLASIKGIVLHLLLPFLVVGTAAGAVLAAVAFAISAVSIPMLVDKPQMTAMEAIAISFRTVLANPAAMVFWAGLIVVFTAMAMVPFFLGLALVIPLVGHATWHAYRDLVA